MTDEEKRTAIEECLVKNHDRLVFYAKRYNRQDAEDLVSRVAIHALSKSAKLKDGKNIYGWLCTMMFHLYVNKYRRDVKHSNISKRIEEGFDTEDTRELGSDEQLKYDDLALLVSQISHVYFLVIYLKSEGFSYREVVEKLGIPLGTVMSRLHRAREAARELVEGRVPQKMDYPLEGSTAYKILALAKQKVGDEKIAEQLGIKTGLVSVTKSHWRKRGVDIPYLRELKTNLKKPLESREKTFAEKTAEITEARVRSMNPEPAIIHPPVESEVQFLPSSGPVGSRPIQREPRLPQALERFGIEIRSRIYNKLRNFPTTREEMISEIAVLKELVSLAESLER